MWRCEPTRGSLIIVHKSRHISTHIKHTKHTYGTKQYIIYYYIVYRTLWVCVCVYLECVYVQEHRRIRRPSFSHCVFSAYSGGISSLSKAIHDFHCAPRNTIFNVVEMHLKIAGTVWKNVLCVKHQFGALDRI